MSEAVWTFRSPTWDPNHPALTFLSDSTPVDWLCDLRRSVEAYMATPTVYLPSAPGEAAAPASAQNQEQEAVHARYDELVNKKYEQGLTRAEATEMRWLLRQIDEFYAPAYEPTLKKLRAELERRRGR
jgi:hypothetical protein